MSSAENTERSPPPRLYFLQICTAVKTESSGQETLCSEGHVTSVDQQNGGVHMELRPDVSKKKDETVELSVCSHGDDPSNKDYLFCEVCKSFFFNKCEVHGPPLFIADTPVPMEVPDRATRTLPPGLEIRKSGIPDAGLGVFNKGDTVPVGAHFGPYQGELVDREEAVKSGYSWVIYKRSQSQESYLDAKREIISNWMRYVNCARNGEEQNLVAFQYQGGILYRCCRSINPGQELLVGYDKEYAKDLGPVFYSLWRKKCSTYDFLPMEPAAKRRKISPVWQHFEQVSENKVKCLLCSKELGYNNNTSSMLRHLRACHDNNEGNTVGPIQVDRKEELDEALVSMIVRDTQPFSIVEDSGFTDFVSKLDSTYVLPTRKTVKAMVEARYNKEKEKAKAEVQNVQAVSLTADLWTSLNMDAYLAVTCHFIDNHTCLGSTLLSVVKLPQAHTAENLACVKSSLMEEWGIQSKVTCLVTDGSCNMIASAKELKLRHAVCVAHTLNTMVKKALEQTPVLANICSKARKLVGYFRSSTTAKEKLDLVQEKMGKPKKKLMQEVETRWNSTYQMLERLGELREPVGAALAGLQTDNAALTSEEYSHVSECLSILSPFHAATLELTEEEQVSGSKVVPLLNMIEKMLQEEAAKVTGPVAKELGEHLIRLLREKLHKCQNMSIFSLPTLLDPRYKTLGFFSPTKADEVIKQLTSECANVIGSRQPPSSPAAASTSLDTASERPGNKLWCHFDAMMMESRRTQNVTADATIEVQRYLAEPNISRAEDPLQYWEKRRRIYPHLYRLAVEYLCTPASSVPCQMVFSKSGEVISRKRNRLSPSTVEKLLFLNKNE